MTVTTTGRLQRLKNGIDCEEDLQEYLEAGMESNGWTVLREVKPKSSEYRADIVASRDDIGWVGIECKYVTGGPVVAAKAARQVFDKYADEKYLNTKVSAWGVCLYGHRFAEHTRDRDYYDRDRYYYCEETRRSTYQSVTQRILNGFGLGWTTIVGDRVLLEFLPSEPSVTVPLFQIDGTLPDRYHDEVDMNRIEQFVKQRRPY